MTHASTPRAPRGARPHHADGGGRRPRARARRRPARPRAVRERRPRRHRTGDQRGVRRRRNSGATYAGDFVELLQPDRLGRRRLRHVRAVPQRRRHRRPVRVIPLTGAVPAHGHYLVAERRRHHRHGAADPRRRQVDGQPDAGPAAPSSSPPAPPPSPRPRPVASAACRASSTWSATATANACEGPAPVDRARPDANTSAARGAAGTDTDDNAPTSPPAAPTPAERLDRPRRAAGRPGRAQTSRRSRAAARPARSAEQSVVTKGVVTAAYPTGGFNGYYLQTPGTGGALDLGTHDTSDARLRVRSAAARATRRSATTSRSPARSASSPG